MSEEAVDCPKNHVRVGFRASKFLYIDITRHLLHDGEPDVVVSALGLAINEAVSVVEMLKDQNIIKVTKIVTCRGEVENSRRNAPTDKIEITVVKAPGFDAKYEEQQKVRGEKKAAKEAAALE